MGVMENGSGLSGSDALALMANNGNRGGFGFGGDGAWWLLVLFLFAFSGNWGGVGNGNNNSQMPYWLGSMNNTTNNDVQRGFDQQSIMGGINGLTSAVTTGFSNAEVSRCNGQTNILQALNANQSATNAAMNSLAMSLQNCCCDNRASVADLKYTVATENCADRAAVNDGIRDVIANQNANTQAIINSQNAGYQSLQDKLCQLELDGIKQRNADLLAENNSLKFAQSQTAQTAAMQASQAAQTAQIIQAINPSPIPAYVVQNPSCCNTGYNNGCGCSGVA